MRQAIPLYDVTQDVTSGALRGPCRGLSGGLHPPPAQPPPAPCPSSSQAAPTGLPPAIRQCRVFYFLFSGPSNKHLKGLPYKQRTALSSCPLFLRPTTMLKAAGHLPFCFSFLFLYSEAGLSWMCRNLSAISVRTILLVA